MTSGSMRYWLRPTLGAVLFIAAAAGIAYKVISGYRHAAPDAFISVQDQKKMQAASAANPATANSSTEVPAAAADAATPSNGAPSAVSSTPAPPSPAAPSLTPRAAGPPASSGAADVNLSADGPNDAACVAIQTEQHEIEGALSKKYSPEEGRYMQRRLRELTEQSVKHKCGE
jgi:hypothetical protein